MSGTAGVLGSVGQSDRAMIEMAPRESTVTPEVGTPKFFRAAFLAGVAGRTRGALPERGHGARGPAGFIEVRDMFGELVATGTLPESNVLPGTARKVQATTGDSVEADRLRWWVTGVESVLRPAA